MYGAWFQRAWRLYLAGSIAGFRTGTLQLFQVSFAGAKRRVTTWTRAPLYAKEDSPWTSTTSWTS
jgi:cyclopropane-fatty-acyl-phospholipid synthase